MSDEATVYVKDIMTKKVITVQPSDSVDDVVACVLEKRVNGVPVVDGDGKLCGIVTVTNLFQLLDSILFDDPLNNYLRDTNATVEDIMTSDVITVAPTTLIKEVVHTSLYKNIHAFPVMENERLVGIIGKKDILKAGLAIAKNQ